MTDAAIRHDRDYMPAKAPPNPAEQRLRDATVLDVAAEVCESNKLVHTAEVLRGLAAGMRQDPTPRIGGPPRFRFFIQCADNPTRYLGRAYDGLGLSTGCAWVEKDKAEESWSAEEAAQWRDNMAAVYPKLSCGRSNTVIEVRDMEE